MYLYKDKLAQEKIVNPEASVPGRNDDDMQEEINRVASTLIRLMEVSR